MKYSLTHKISLTPYGFPYETLDLMIEDCESKEQAEQIIRDWENDVKSKLSKQVKGRLDRLNAKSKLTTKEEVERQTLLDVSYNCPF
jgi:hypothetical protein